MAPRALFYVQHLLGIGHLQRAGTIARAMAEAGIEVDFVSGGERASIDIGGARLRQLPTARAADKDFSAIVDQNGRKIDEAWRADRCALLLSLYHSIRPDIVLIEMFPFGRHQFRFELIPLLEAALADRKGPIVAASVRDILVEKKRPDRVEQTLSTLRRYFSAALVHADPEVVRFERTFERAGEIADLIQYTGFVVDRPPHPISADRDKGEVLVSAGGGAVGARLLQNAILARPLCRHRDRVWRVITGTNMDPGEVAAIKALAALQPGIVVEAFRPDFRALLGQCAMSISQAGYNTLLEVVAARAPGVVVPFATQSESEQTLRATLFAQKGLIEMVEEAALDPAALAGAIDRAREPERMAIDLAGAENTATALLTRWRARKEPT